MNQKRFNETKKIYDAELLKLYESPERTEEYLEFIDYSMKLYKMPFISAFSLYVQNASEVCATLDGWNKLGRKVKRAEKGITALVSKSGYTTYYNAEQTVGKPMNKQWGISASAAEETVDYYKSSRDIDTDLSFEKLINSLAYTNVYFDDGDIIENLSNYSEEQQEEYLEKLVDVVRYTALKRCELNNGGYSFENPVCSIDFSFADIGDFEQFCSYVQKYAAETIKDVCGLYYRSDIRNRTIITKEEVIASKISSGEDISAAEIEPVVTEDNTIIIGNDDVIVEEEKRPLSEEIISVVIDDIMEDTYSLYHRNDRYSEVLSFKSRYADLETYDEKVSLLTAFILEYGSRNAGSIVNDKEYIYDLDENGVTVRQYEDSSVSETTNITFATINSLVAKKIDTDAYVPSSLKKENEELIFVEKKIKKNPRIKAVDESQLSFFNFTEAPEITEPVTTELDPAVLDHVLRCGSVKDKSIIRIVSQFRLYDDTAINSEFLKNEFSEYGMGYVIPDSEKKYAVVFNKSGITIAEGENFKNCILKTTYSWEQAAQRIEELLQEGAYADQLILDLAEKYEINELSKTLRFLESDLIADYNSFFPDEIKNKHDEEIIAEYISDKEKLRKFVDNEFATFLKDYDFYKKNGQNVLRFNNYKPHDIADRLSRLADGSRDFKADKQFALDEKYFVTEEQKELVIKNKTGLYNKIELSDFHKEERDEQEGISKLKDLFGMGGSSDSMGNFDYDGKGIAYSYGSYQQSKVSCPMKWNEVNKIVKRLIKEDSFISQDEIDTELKRIERLRSRNIELDKYQQNFLDRFGKKELTVLEAFRSKTDEHFVKIKGHSAADIEDYVKYYVDNVLFDNYINGEIGEVVLSGSRCRGLETADSDVDVIVEIKGADISENALFNYIHENKIDAGGVLIDINPIRPEETGDIETYLLSVEEYLNKKREEKEQLEKAKENIRSYLESEFLSDNISFDDLEHISAGYTELGENNEHGFQMEIDLVNLKIRYELDNEIVKTESYNSLEEMNESALSVLNFDDFYAVGDDVLDTEEKDSKTVDSLADRLTENHDGKFKIEEYYKKTSPSAKDLADYIKSLVINDRQGFGLGGYAASPNGITLPDLSEYSWEQVAQAVIKAIENDRYISAEERAEKPDEPKYTIYQIKKGEEYHKARFTDWKELKRFNVPFDKNSYEYVYGGYLTDISRSLNKAVILDDIFRKFNVDRPEDFRGHSLSISDIIVLEDKNGSSAFFVDSSGMTDVTDLFLNTEKQKINLMELSEITLSEKYYRREDEPDDFTVIENTIRFCISDSPELVRLYNNDSSDLIRRRKDFTYDYNFMPDADEGDTFVTRQDMLSEVSEFFEDSRSDSTKSISITDMNGKTTVLEGRLFEFEITNSEEKEKEADKKTERTAEDIKIGDKYILKNFFGEKEVTVTSMEGIYPDDVGITEISRGAGGQEYSVTTNINKEKLHKDGIYLGNEADIDEGKSFSQKVDDVLSGKADRYNDIKVCDTPQILLDVGCEQLPMLYTKSDLRDALHEKSEKNNHWHGLTVEQIKKVPQLLSEPVIIFDSISPNKVARNSIVAVLNAFDNDKAPLIVSIKPNGKGTYQLEKVDSNFITSIYGKDSNFENFIQRAVDSNNILFWNKEKSQEMFSVLGLQLPKGLNNLDFNTIIHQSRNIVKGFVQKNTSDIIVENKPVVPAQDYRYNEQDKVIAGPKQKYKANVEAIKLLKALEAENRNATPEEQSILAKYSGWGGAPQAFDKTNILWRNEYNELKELLDDEEYEAARASTLTAYYTPPEIIDAVYTALENFGFEGGNVLEPSMAVGNFFAKMPENMRNSSKLYGVELDSISGRIAKKLYPSANIQIKGFEKTSFRDNSFDVVIGNIPFGDFKVVDKKYDKYNFSIHDYFIAKALDQVKPGGVVAFVTSKYTMDKQGSSVRRYIAERATLLGAVRLPVDAFKNSGTETTTDILFFKKRKEREIVHEPEWLEVKEDADGVAYNSYFHRRPEMMLGKMAFDERMRGKYGEDAKVTACYTDNEDPRTFTEKLNEAISRIDGKMSVSKAANEALQKQEKVITADPNVRNFTYTLVDGELYYRENEIMRRSEATGVTLDRIVGIHKIREAAMTLITEESQNCSDERMTELQRRLNDIYDKFVKKYGYLNDSANVRAFADDDDSNTILALENKTDEKNYQKAAIFFKRTIMPDYVANKVETADEALQVSIDRLGRVDLTFMAQLSDISEDKLIEELGNRIFRNPLNADEDKAYSGYEEASEYLSGNVRKKLATAKAYAETDSSYERNVTALEKVMPPKIPAQEISVRLGSAWIEDKTYNEFFEYYAHEITSRSYSNKITRTALGEYKFTDGTRSYSTSATEIFGTNRFNSFQIFEALLNQKQINVYDTVYEDGKERRVVNAAETRLAREKARQMEEAFKTWIWSDIDRREYYETKYNETFNCLVGREYNGDFQRFDGMSTEITLKKHQKDAVLRAKLGGNTLFAHVVGAGKSFEMITSVQEKKRLGLISKACVTVPKALTEQMGAEWMRLYPNAKILVATTADFSKDKRQQFIARCATGDYDAIIMSHEQFGKIGMSSDYQNQFIRNQISQLDSMISGMGYSSESRVSVKSLEKQRKRLEAKLDKALNVSRDNSLSFEKLGFDFLVVDEAHMFKNCFINTKMGNIAGVQTTASNKATDMLMKCDYLNERYGCNNILFATGTPISNSMTEMYVMMRYLRPDILRETGTLNFDDWAAAFGETVTKMEPTPDGSGFRSKKRFAKFVNLPELVAQFKECADIKTGEMLDLDVPDIRTGGPQTITTAPDEYQKMGVKELAERSELIHSGCVDPSADNMLKITGEARLLGLDARTKYGDVAGENENGKLSMVCKNALKIYNDTTEKKGVQAIFCDIAVNNDDGKFSAYDAIKSKLISCGIPEEEICFAGDAKNERQRAEQHQQLREGKKRIVIGSTSKLGTGVNIQDRLAAIHHLDIAWKPSDFEQRNGRGVRQGNMFKEIDIFHYVTQDTFDMYMMETIVRKSKFINQIMTSKCTSRSCEDVDDMTLTYSRIQAATTTNPLIIERMELDEQIRELKFLRSNYQKQQYDLQEAIERSLPQSIEKHETLLSKAKEDSAKYSENVKQYEGFAMTLNGEICDERTEITKYLNKAQAACSMTGESIFVGQYCGFDVRVERKDMNFFLENPYKLVIQGALKYETDFGLNNGVGNTVRIEKLLEKEITAKEKAFMDFLEKAKSDLAEAKKAYGKPFPREEEYQEKSARFEELNELLSADNKAQAIINAGEEDDTQIVGEDDEDSVSYSNLKKYTLTNENDDDTLDLTKGSSKGRR